MSLHTVAIHLQAPEGYLGSCAIDACTSPTCDRRQDDGTYVERSAYHWECFSNPAGAWSCECPACLNDMEYLFIDAERVYYADPPMVDEDPEDRDNGDEGPGVCSDCYRGTHHQAFMQQELARARQPQEA